jgi:hypothetical protein
MNRRRKMDSLFYLQRSQKAVVHSSSKKNHLAFRPPKKIENFKEGRLNFHVPQLVR